MIILITIICFLSLSLFVALIEKDGGYLGDSSMVPGILIVGTLAVIALSLFTGHIIIK